MSDETYRFVCWAMLAFFLGAVLLLALASRKRYREADEMQATADELTPSLDAPGIDEDWAHRFQAGPEGDAQTTRDNGA